VPIFATWLRRDKPALIKSPSENLGTFPLARAKFFRPTVRACEQFCSTTRSDVFETLPRYLCCIIAELVFWVIVGGQEVGRRQVSLRCAPKPVRTLVTCRSQYQIMNADLIKAASEVIPNQQILVNMVSRRVRQLSLGHRPLVEYAPGLREADIALTEIANKKLTFESTFGQNETAASVEVVQFPKVIVTKKAVSKKKAA
jgi:DNA-directed RNA polymerase subunit omega